MAKHTDEDGRAMRAVQVILFLHRMDWRDDAMQLLTWSAASPLEQADKETRWLRRATHDGCTLQCLPDEVLCRVEACLRPVEEGRAEMLELGLAPHYVAWDGELCF